jgi:NADH:ubiquinone oxidoreductase subunit F (NADH-binding)
MQAAGYAGAGILGSDFNFKVDVKLVPGPVPWGAGSRLTAALEGRRSVPCGQPAGLHGFPTVVHAPETLGQLPAIIRRGADGYAGLGVNGHKGIRLISLSGAVRKAGYYDVPMGTALRDIVNGFGNGVPDGETLKAVQVGGPTGGWIPAQALDIPLDPQALNTAGASLGPGMVTVVTQDACAPDLACQALVYASGQSCGHCLFCREGTRQMAEILTDIINGGSRPEDLDVLAELAEGVKLNSACRLGRTAPDAYLSTMRYFPEEYDAHMKTKRCPAGACGLG